MQAFNIQLLYCFIFESEHPNKIDERILLTHKLFTSLCIIGKSSKKGTIQESVGECDKKKLIIKNNNTRKRKKTQLGELILSYF